MIKVKSSKLEVQSFGFTLVELLVVMTIIAVLAGLALVSYQGAKKSARDGERKADLEQIRSALEMCYADTGNYPASIYNNIACGSPVKTYLSGTPRDPVTQDAYYYSRPTVSSYTLCAFLEVGGVSGSCGGASCGSGRICNYRVTNP